MEEQLTWKSPESNSMVSATIGRAMTDLLSARPKKLEDAISRLGSAPKRGSLVSLEESLRVLHAYVRDAARREESLDEILVPMTEHSLGHKDSKHGNQAMILINWIFQDEVLFQALATNIAGIIRRKEDHYIALGWCKLVRGLIEYEITMKQFVHNGIKEKYCLLLRILSSCIIHLTSIVCHRSTAQGEFELPTRLSVAAADCILAITTALTKKDPASDGSDERPGSLTLSDPPMTLSSAALKETKVKPTIKSIKVSDDMEMKLLLWDNLNQLIVLVQRLFAWSRKSRSLHAKGLERVLKWLESTQQHYSHFQTTAGKVHSKNFQTGLMLLSSCWKHYGLLMQLEGYKFAHYKELLNEYLSGIQFYADNYAEEHTQNKDSGAETIKFFLNCTSLLLGHFDGKQFESAMSEYGPRICRVLISQLHSEDEDVIDGAVCILKAVIFRTNNTFTGTSLTDTREMDAVLPLLLNLLDEQDGAARAIVVLIAEYCSISTDNRCLQEILKRLSCGNIPQRRNAVDIISEIFRLSPDRICCRQEIANQLLERLGDEELVIRVQASNLIPVMDPSLIVPALVDLVYSSDEVLLSSASKTLAAVLKHHSKKFEVLCMLLNCLSNLCQNRDLPDDSGRSKLDAEKVLMLIPEWSESVEDWNLLIEPLIDKMFAEPSNAIIVRFLSRVSEHLADAADVVFHRVLMHMRQQNKWKNQNYDISSTVKLENSLFYRLCPLLIIRLLPLRVFNDLNSSAFYGEGCNQDMGYLDINNAECVAGILIDRAFDKLEFEDVRKLAAELCGRIHPQVLVPVIASQLEIATNAHDLLKIKACLFSICTSLVVRGKDSFLHPLLPQIRNQIETILLWPTLDGDEVAKAQHGCIDCLALMICTEIQAPELFRDLTSKKTSLVGDAKMKNSVLSYVIHQLTCENSEFVCSTKMGSGDSINEALSFLSFRLCMANVLISACQKVNDPGKKLFSRNLLPRLFQSIEVTMESEIRAACVQVFFSAVYYLKSEILPYASDLLKVSLNSLREGSEKEKLAGAKLMASLMASEEGVVESIAVGLLEARTVLSHASSSDPSVEVRQMSTKLLECLTSL